MLLRTAAWLCLSGILAVPAQAQFSLKKLKDQVATSLLGESAPRSQEAFPAEWFALKREPFQDPEMSREAIERMLRKAPEFAQVDTFLTIHITEIQKGQCPDEWWVYTNALGVPTHKNSNRYIRVIVRGKDGKCYYSDTIPFRRDYQGGTYTKPIKYSGTRLQEVPWDVAKPYCS